YRRPRKHTHPPTTYTPHTPPQPRTPPFPYTTLFRSGHDHLRERLAELDVGGRAGLVPQPDGRAHAGHLVHHDVVHQHRVLGGVRSEEHTSELQSRFDLVSRLLLEEKKRSAANSDRCG